MIPGHLSFTFSHSAKEPFTLIFTFAKSGSQSCTPIIASAGGCSKICCFKACWWQMLILSFLLRFLSSESEVKKNHFPKCYKCPTWKANALLLIITNLTFWGDDLHEPCGCTLAPAPEGTQALSILTGAQTQEKGFVFLQQKRSDPSQWICIHG